MFIRKISKIKHFLSVPKTWRYVTHKVVYPLPFDSAFCIYFTIYWVFVHSEIVNAEYFNPENTIIEIDTYDKWRYTTTQQPQEAVLRGNFAVLKILIILHKIKLAKAPDIHLRLLKCSPHH